ncbi:MAG TPA: hypothetical protein VGA88_00965 [Burkholderiales bacterium]
MKVGIGLRGLEETVRGFRNLGEASQFRITRNAARAGATTVRAALKKAAPRGTAGAQSVASSQYGTLRKNIATSQLRAGGKFLPYYKVTTGDAFWGGFLESGTGRYNIDPGPKAKGAGARTHILPTFWFSQAVERIRPQVITAMVANMRRSIVREFAKIK